MKDEYWNWRRFLFEYITTDEPLGAIPYLCVSHEMLVTPSTLKSNAVSHYEMWLERLGNLTINVEAGLLHERNLSTRRLLRDHISA